VEELDRAIISHLAADGRMSFTDLGRVTGLSTSAVHQRVRRLEQRGVIRGYRAILDMSVLDLQLSAFVSIKTIDPTADENLPERLAQHPAVQSCYSVAGEESYILKVRVPSPEALEAFLLAIRSELRVATRTTVVLTTPFEDRLPL
jgi:Lrp/AsnC family leucine-responsive transcriptional regulator